MVGSIGDEREQDLSDTIWLDEPDRVVSIWYQIEPSFRDDARESSRSTGTYGGISRSCHDKCWDTECSCLLGVVRAREIHRKIEDSLYVELAGTVEELEHETFVGLADGVGVESHIHPKEERPHREILDDPIVHELHESRTSGKERVHHMECLEALGTPPCHLRELHSTIVGCGECNQLVYLIRMMGGVVESVHPSGGVSEDHDACSCNNFVMEPADEAQVIVETTE